MNPIITFILIFPLQMANRIFLRNGSRELKDPKNQGLTCPLLFARSHSYTIVVISLVAITILLAPMAILFLVEILKPGMVAIVGGFAFCFSIIISLFTDARCVLYIYVSHSHSIMEQLY
jgi:hypothetical protein